MVNTILLAAILVSGGAISDAPERPNIENWTVMPNRQVDMRPGDYLKGLVGQVVIYQNPENKNEFVKIYYRQVALVSERPGENKGGKQSGRGTISGGAGSSFHIREEKAAIERVQKAKDAFAFVYWHVFRDLRTGQDILYGEVESWLLGASGQWSYVRSKDLGVIKEIPLSEPYKYDPKQSIVVGVRYVLGNTENIVRVDQDDLKAPKPDKGKAAEKGKTNAK